MPADAGACSVNQTLLSCTDRDSGVATICLSDNANACPGDDPLTVDDCKSLCPSGSYAAACGGLPPADGGAQPSSAPPSDACTSNGGTPGGVATYCCPCGS